MIELESIDKFDPYNPAHMEAYTHLCAYTSWPEGFQIKALPPTWHVTLMAKLADAYRSEYHQKSEGKTTAHWLLDCELATVADLAGRSRVTKSELSRHILIAQKALNAMKGDPIILAGLGSRAQEVLTAHQGDVTDWVLAWRGRLCSEKADQLTRAHLEPNPRELMR